VSVTAVPGRGFGELLRRWRGTRGLSQLELSAATGVSSRHLSFLETGRSRPSRQIVLFLAEQLDVPLPDRNDLLLAAGFAPAVVMDGHWNRLLANEGTRVFLGDVAPFLLAELRFLNTMTSFGAPMDATLAEVVIEAFYPADELTREVLAGRALPDG
jgi:transcriptional regulator with XRE-family HTH domain